MDQVLLVGEGLTLGFLFKLYGEVKVQTATLKTYIKNADRRFFALAKDFKDSKNS